MRIAIATTYVPFRPRGDDGVAEDLAAALATAGHEVDTVRLPVDPRRPRLLEQAVAIRLLDLSESCGNTVDRLIALGYPATALAHPAKVAWLHHAEDAAAAADRPERLPEHGPRRRSERVYLREARRVFAANEAVSGRLRAAGIEPHGVVRRPLRVGHPFRPGAPGDDVVAVGPPGPAGRRALAVEALGHCRPAGRLIVVGATAAGESAGALRELARCGGVEDRVEFADALPESRRAELLARCRAVLCLGDGDEASVAALEAFHCGKPVLTCRDAGAVTELVEDDFNGLVVEPEPRAVAEALERVWADRLTAAALGRQALATPGALGITWERVREHLAA